MTQSPRSHGLMTINSGSSSLKIALFRIGDDVIKTMSGTVTGIGAETGQMTAQTAYGDTLWEREAYCVNHPVALDAFFHEMAEHVDIGTIDAVGHRVVHGGPHFTAPQKLTAAVEADLRKLATLAPLHMPANLDGIVAARQRFPDAVQFACFDTSFHTNMPQVAQRTGLPRALEDGLIRRYGFHGLSYAFIVEDLEARLGAAISHQRLLVAHLGAGASMAAIHQGQTVDTSMGFSALAGLPMATRSGDVDPGLLFYLILQKGWAPDSLQDKLYHGAGLLGLSGLSGDVETLVAAQNTPRAKEALDQFSYQSRKQAGALIAAMGGVDRIIFTGGIGENAPEVRSAICEPLSDFLGIAFDADANAKGAPVISKTGSAVVVETVHTDEALMIARAGRAILKANFALQPRRAS